MSGRHKTIPIFVPHLGCPQDCLFCNQRAITGQIEKMTPEKAKEIILAGTKKRASGDTVEIGFFGGSFTGIPAPEQEAFLQPAFEAVSQGKADGIRLSTRPDYISEAVISRLKRFGVTTVELGAQSMCDAVLLKARRGHNAQQTKKAAEMIRNAGLNLGLQMMLGLPGDSFEESVKTAKAFIALKPACVRIYPTLVLRDTGLHQLFLSGEYEPLSVETAVSQCASLYQLFRKENIEVIRMGLLDMDREAICAGPFHPAFGELVMSRVCFERLKSELSAYIGQAVILRTNPRFVSVLVGQKRENILKLKNDLNIKQITIEQDDKLSLEEIVILQKD